MGPPRTRAQNLAAAAAARSRFLEGSMNDRASAAPPVAFLGPAERAALEKPVAGGDDEDAVPGREQRRRRQQEQQQQGGGRRAAGRMRLGLVWEGVRGRLRMRREAGGAEDGPAAGRGRKKSSASASSAPPAQRAGDGRAEGGVGRPSREEVLASYQQLVSTGFFANHAVYSTRRPPPGGAPVRPATAHEEHHHRRQPSQEEEQHPCSPPSYPPPPPPCPDRLAPPPPQWPLTPKPRLSTPASPVCSPASLASSRGTKRPAADDDQDEGVDAARSPSAPRGDDDHHHHHQDDDASTLAHRFLPKRLRRSASRDISLPRVRGPRRAVSDAALPTPRDQPRRRARLALPVNAPGSRAGARASLVVVPGHHDDAAAAPRRCPSGPRNLRPRIVGGPLSVVPDANRGIPGVPAIPAKFSRSADQENDDGARVRPRP